MIQNLRTSNGETYKIYKTNQVMGPGLYSRVSSGNTVSNPITISVLKENNDGTATQSRQHQPKS